MWQHARKTPSRNKTNSCNVWTALCKRHHARIRHHKVSAGECKVWATLFQCRYARISCIFTRSVKVAQIRCGECFASETTLSYVERQKEGNKDNAIQVWTAFCQYHQACVSQLIAVSEVGLGQVGGNPLPVPQGSCLLSLEQQSRCLCPASPRSHSSTDDIAWMVTLITFGYCQRQYACAIQSPTDTEDCGLTGTPVSALPMRTHPY